MNYLKIFGLMFIFISSNSAFALPDFWKPVGFSEISNVTLYPDHEDPNQYYVLPNIIEVAKSNGNMLFGMTHRGITGYDIDGVGGTLVFTAKAGFNDESFSSNTWSDFVEENPEAKISIIQGHDHKVGMRLLKELVDGPSKSLEIKGRPQKPEEGIPKITISSTSADSIETEGEKNLNVEVKPSELDDLIMAGAPNIPFAFEASLSRLGAKQIAYGNEDIDVNDRPLAINILYSMKYTVLGKRYKIKITANFDKIQKYFQENSSKSRWFGISKKRNVKIVKSLVSNGSVKIETIEGALSPDEQEKAGAHELFNLLSKARINGTGMFKPTFQPTAIAGGGGKASGFLGWGSSSSTFNEVITENATTTFIISKKATQELTHTIGFSIPIFCQENPELFTNLTNNTPRCVDAKSLDLLNLQAKNCLIKKNDLLDKLEERLVLGEVEPERHDLLHGKVIQRCVDVSRAGM